MLVLSLLFVSLVVLLVFCLTKDKGTNTIHARKGTEKVVSVSSEKTHKHAHIDSTSVFE